MGGGGDGGGDGGGVDEAGLVVLRQGGRRKRRVRERVRNLSCSKMTAPDYQPLKRPPHWL